MFEQIAELMHGLTDWKYTQVTGLLLVVVGVLGWLLYKGKIRIPGLSRHTDDHAPKK